MMRGLNADFRFVPKREKAEYSIGISRRNTHNDFLDFLLEDLRLLVLRFVALRFAIAREVKAKIGICKTFFRPRIGVSYHVARIAWYSLYEKERIGRKKNPFL